MQEEPQAEASEEPTAEAEGTTPDSGDAEVSDAVDQQAATSSGEAALDEPEVPDDSRETITRAQDHINKLDMDQQRDAAKKAI
ncbi:MAG: hypothetical protein M3N04_03485 [Actinomycetota bacterium]|nr:hypothetical protein [Actinomycetota bacterium]